MCHFQVLAYFYYFSICFLLFFAYFFFNIMLLPVQLQVSLITQLIPVFFLNFSLNSIEITLPLLSVLEGLNCTPSFSRYILHMILILLLVYYLIHFFNGDASDIDASLRFLCVTFIAVLFSTIFAIYFIKLLLLLYDALHYFILFTIALF